MASYSSSRSGHTPATGDTDDPNWALDADTAGDLGKIVAISWGGELTTSTGYRTRWARSDAAAVGAGTDMLSDTSMAVHGPGTTGPNCSLFSGYATTNPSSPTAPQGLFSLSWNAHGGLGYVALPLASPWIVMNGWENDIIFCRNDAGTDAAGSSYGLTWEE